MASRALDLIIGGKDETSGVFASVSGGLRSLAESALSVDGIIAEALSGLAAGFGLEKLFEKAEEADSALKDLHAALTLAGDSSKAGTDSLAEYAEQLSRVTTMSRTSVLEAEKLGAQIGGFTGPALESATKAAIGLSERFKIDLESAMRLVSKAADGNTSALERYGIQVDGSMTNQQKFNEVLRIGTQGFALAEAKTDTLSGKIAQFQNSLGELAEKAGTALFGGSGGLIDGATSMVNKVGDAFGGLVASVTPSLEAFKSTLANAGTWLLDTFGPIVAAGLGTIKTAWNAAGEAIGIAVNGISTAITVGMDYVGKVLDGLGIHLGGFTQTFQVAFISLEFAIGHWRDFLELGIDSALLGVVTFANQVQYFFGTVTPAYLNYLAENWKNIFTDIYNGTTTIITNLGENLEKFFNAVWSWLQGDGFDFEWKGLLDGFKSTMTELPKIVERQKGDLETALSGMVDDLNSKISDGFLDFLNKRLKETSGATSDALKNLFKGPDNAPHDAVPSGGGGKGSDAGESGGRGGGGRGGDRFQIASSEGIGMTGVAEQARAQFQNQENRNQADALKKAAEAMTAGNKTQSDTNTTLNALVAAITNSPAGKRFFPT